MVLGMEDKRGCCTADDVRNAYRARVLLYHPDKIAQNGGKGKGAHQKDDSIFKCIQKAFQTLSDADKKEAFDHVDPTFDNSIPEEKLPAGADFYATYGPVFARNMKFSRKTTSLTLGGPETPREAVEDFYQFWFDFDSIRRFDYLDEDDSESLENRADKRYQDKKNKAARLKRKNEDNARLRRLVEQAYKLDPRIKAYKEADKQAKAAKKAQPKTVNGKQSNTASASAEAAAKAKAEEAERLAAIEAAAKEAKKAKEAEASALRREKKALKTLFADNNYFVPTTLDAAGKLKLLEEEAALVEQVCSKLARMEIQAVREAVQAVVEQGADTAAITNILRERVGAALKVIETPVAVIDPVITPVVAVPVDVSGTVASAAWTLQDTDLLINGTKKFPGGTRNRWETIADWYNRQSSNQRTVEEILAKANEIKAAATNGPVTGGMTATPLETAEAVGWEPSGKRDPRIDQNEPTLASMVVPESTSVPWTAEEQAALEAAIKGVGADVADRWDRIAQLVQTRTKKECMLRAKELATLLKRKLSSH